MPMTNFKINLRFILSAPTASCGAPLQLTASDMVSPVVDSGMDFTGNFNVLHIDPGTFQEKEGADMESM